MLVVCQNRETVKLLWKPGLGPVSLRMQPAPITVSPHLTFWHFKHRVTASEKTLFRSFQQRLLKRRLSGFKICWAGSKYGQHLHLLCICVSHTVWKLKVTNHSTILVCCDVWLETNINCVPRWLRPSLLLKQGPTGYEQRRETSSQREHVFLFSNLLYLYFQISCICIFKSFGFELSNLLYLYFQISCICIFKSFGFELSNLLYLRHRVYLHHNASGTVDMNKGAIKGRDCG